MSLVYRLIGRGVYTPREAERLTGVPQRRIRRWTRGYYYRLAGKRRYSPPVIGTETKPIAGTPVLDFSDLIEVRFLEAFRQHGVSWYAIRTAALRARELMGRHRPFSTRIFKTDGQTILAEIVETTGDKALLDLVRNQWEFQRIVSPLLYEGLEFNELDEPMRWWPMGTERQVVIDPLKSFGAPVTAAEGVPTRVLAAAYEADESIDFVAACFMVAPVAVQDAVEFETSLAS